MLRSRRETTGYRERLIQFLHLFIHSFIHHPLSAHVLMLPEVVCCALRIQREISCDPLLKELMSAFGDTLQAGWWVGEEGKGTGGQGVSLDLPLGD